MILYQLQDSILMSPGRRDKLILMNLFLSLALNMVLWLLLILNFWQAREYIILGYNIYFGISAFGQWYQILLLPLLGLIVILLNFSLSFYLYLKEKLISYFLASTALIFHLIIFLASVIIIYVNI